MSRREIPAKWIRDKLPHECVNCGSTVGLVYHHIVPVELGGNEVPSNIAVLCSVCHGRVHYGKDGEINHGDLVRSGLKRAKSSGVKLGKPSADYDKIMKLVAEHSTMFEGGDWTEGEIRDAAGVQNVCYCKVKRMMKDELNSGVWNHDFPKPKRIRNVPLYDHLIRRLRLENIDVATYR